MKSSSSLSKGKLVDGSIKKIGHDDGVVKGGIPKSRPNIGLEKSSRKRNNELWKVP